MAAAKAKLEKDYRVYLNKMMAHKGGYEYDADHRYSEAELLEITPEDVARFLKALAYHTSVPGPNDLPPVYARSNTLAQTKKAISYFMPHRDASWNVHAKYGNPTKSRVVNYVIKDVRKMEVRKQGKASQAKRDMKRPEFRKTLQLINDDPHQSLLDKLRFSTMIRFQFHIVGRSDDMCHLEQTADLRSHEKFGDFCLQTKVSWSKNVVEERDCPDQILIGANDVDFCVLLALGCYLESRFTLAEHDPKYLFGKREESDEPAKAKLAYRYLLGKVWKHPEFKQLLAQVRGEVGTHSVRKFPATFAAENGCSEPEVEIRGRWKGHKSGRVVNRYISPEQLTTDAKVAGVLAVGGPIKYRLKQGSNVTPCLSFSDCGTWNCSLLSRTTQQSS